MCFSHIPWPQSSAAREAAQVYAGPAIHQWEVAVNLKEHVQFLVMMIPTVLLLIAAVITLAAPAKAAQQQPNAARPEFIVAATNIGPDRAPAVR